MTDRWKMALTFAAWATVGLLVITVFTAYDDWFRYISGWTRWLHELGGPMRRIGG